MIERKKEMKKIFFIVVFAISIILNIFSMVNYKTRKDSVLNGVYHSLKNISVLLGGIKTEIELENPRAVDYLHRELDFCYRELSIQIQELCYGVSPIRNYDDSNLGLTTFREFDFAIYEKDIDAIRVYLSMLDELIEELSEEETSSNLSDYEFLRGVDYSLTLKAIINKFELFNEKISNYR